MVKIMDSSYNPSDDCTLRVSKSSCMTFVKCPRQYWWRYIALRDMDIPRTPQMIRGTQVHDALEQMYEKMDGEKTAIDLRKLMPQDSDDEALDVMADLQAQIIEQMGDDATPIAFEERLQVYDEKYDVMLVGIPDAVLSSDGNLIIAELKTGQQSSSKISRVRQELCFYRYLFELLGHEVKDTFFMYIAPDCENFEVVEMFQSKKNGDAVYGLVKGWAGIEKMNMRSYNSFKKKYDLAINNLKSANWEMKWSDYFCPTWCDFHLSCEGELLGDAPSPIPGDDDR